jgi:hypothetical protein
MNPPLLLDRDRWVMLKISITSKPLSFLEKSYE